MRQPSTMSSISGQREHVRRVGVPDRLDRRGRHGRAVGLTADELTTEVAQLPDESGAVAVHDGSLLRHRRDDRVEVARDELAGPQRRRGVHDRGSADDQPDAAGREPLEVLDVAVRGDAVLHQAGPGRQRDEPVAHVEPADPERREDVREPVVHRVLRRAQCVPGPVPRGTPAVTDSGRARLGSTEIVL